MGLLEQFRGTLFRGSQVPFSCFADAVGLSACRRLRWLWCLQCSFSDVSKIGGPENPVKPVKTRIRRLRGLRGGEVICAFFSSYEQFVSGCLHLVLLYYICVYCCLLCWFCWDLPRLWFAHWNICVFFGLSAYHFCWVWGLTSKTQQKPVINTRKSHDIPLEKQ